LHPALKSYHPFDSDGMLHVVGFRDGKPSTATALSVQTAFWRRTRRARRQWAGLAEPEVGQARGGWGPDPDEGRRAPTSSSTGASRDQLLPVRDLYRIDPYSANTLGKETWNGGFPFDGGSAHPKVDNKTANCCFSTTARKTSMRYGVVDRSNELAHYATSVAWAAAATRYSVHRKLRDTQRFLLFWDPRCSTRRTCRSSIRTSVALRGAATPGLDWGDPVVRADPTFVLHFVNAYEDGDEIVLDGFSKAIHSRWTQAEPSGRAVSFLALDRLQSPAAPVAIQPGHRRGEEQLCDSITEFGTIAPTIRQVTTAIRTPPQ
jgi:carotenoid cleavage dioxygenase